LETLSRTKHILELAKELLDDIELSRCNAEQLVLKTTRLARYVGSDEIKQWLSYEMSGYNDTEPLSLRYMSITGRWIDQKKNSGLWGPLAQMDTSIEANKIQLQTMSIPSTNAQNGWVIIDRITQQMNATTGLISRYGGVKSRVLGLIHKFVSNVYYEKVFDSLSESIFESYKKEIDELIVEKCGEVIHQIPSVIDRLSAGDRESISHALTTCRRIIDSFADTIFPPTDEIINIGGNDLSLKADKVQNRINAYIHQYCESNSRKKKLRQSLSNVYDRVSTGIHNDVDVDEAKALFLNTYLILGEVLSLQQ
jgi:AbiTii